VAILAGATAACSGDVTRLREPLFTGSTPNQREIIGQNGGGGSDTSDLVQPGPSSGGVQTADLAPPPAMPTPMTRAPIAAVPPPAQPAVASNYVYQAAGGRVVTVGPGESLETLALKYGAPVAEIAKANQIHSPADLKPGKVIVIPTRVAMAGPAVVAPVAPEAYAPAAVAAPAQVRAAEAGGGVHVVTPGQTLYSIARQYHTRPEQIAAANGLPSNTAVRIGQKLRIPGAGDGPAKTQLVAYTPSDEKPAGVGAPPKPLGKLVVKNDRTIAVPQSMAEAPALPPEPAAPAQPPAVAAVPPAPPPAAAAPTETPAVAAAAVDAADPPSANGTSFRWPVRGRIISAFGSKPNGERNDGINLAVPEGTSVKAAEAGTVIYAGNELAGYGNLVLIRHADGWVSAYAHNSEILVKRGDKVARGQTIGKAGATGSVNAPQVHFELRKGAKPVNPLDYLAG
jgi:murein DD-endopeptidase MepM/ murein hydrolase activator NlpD